MTVERTMAKQVMPIPDLPARADDLHLTDEQYLHLALFARTKRKPSLDKFPGALVLRRYRQGEAGWTAFYVLTSEDTLAILEPQLEAAQQTIWQEADRRRLEQLEKQVAALRGRIQELQA